MKSLRERVQAYVEYLTVMRQQLLLTKATHEASVRLSLIEAFFNDVLLFDLRNPDIIYPEFSFEKDWKPNHISNKIDYAIFSESEALEIVLEAKRLESKITESDANLRQLRQFFDSGISARIGIISNGVEYAVYSNTKHLNLMDDVPIYTFNLLGPISENDLEVIEAFSTRSGQKILKCVLNLQHVLHTA